VSSADVGAIWLILFLALRHAGESGMIEPELRVQIRRYFFAEHWKIGTIAKQLQVHPDTVRRAIEVERFQSAARLRASNLDPYLAFLCETLEAYPRLCATRLHRMIAERGYTGSIVQLRRAVALLLEDCCFSGINGADSRRCGTVGRGDDGRQRRSLSILWGGEALAFQATALARAPRDRVGDGRISTRRAYIV
jgi:hypothetical protein